MNLTRASTVALLFCFVPGCFSREPININSQDPGAKIPAIKLAAEHNDRTAIAQLVKDLDSDDPAVRFYAIEGLARLTGERFGYQYYDDEDERKPAVRRWQDWLSAEDAGEPAPD